LLLQITGYTLSKLNEPQTISFVDSLRDSLEGSHAIAPPWVWGSADARSPSSSTANLLAERVRAKYYGGIVIIYRPFLRMVLNKHAGIDTGKRAEPHDQSFSNVVPPLVMQYAERCVEALVQSTRVFHQVQRRALILSNPWGTAYA